MWERKKWGEGGRERETQREREIESERERERFPPTHQEDTLLKQQARQSESQKEAGCEGRRGAHKLIR